MDARLSGKDWQILFPRSHRGAVLLAHDAGDLADMAQVMDGPRRQELAESYFSQIGMDSTFRHLIRSQLHAL